MIEKYIFAGIDQGVFAMKLFYLKGGCFNEYQYIFVIRITSENDHLEQQPA